MEKNSLATVNVSRVFKYTPEGLITPEINFLEMAFTLYEQFWPVVYDLHVYIMEFPARRKNCCNWKTQKD